MREYLVDTNMIVDVLKGYGPSTDLLNELTPDGLSICIVTYGELFQGAYYDKDPAIAVAELRSFLERFEVLPVTHRIMEQFGVIRGSLTRHVRDQIGDMDFIIAATGIVHDMTVVTRNLRHFSQIPGVRLYEFDDEWWSQQVH